MAFGKRRRVETELLELVRDELATVRSELQTSLQTSLAESVTLLSTRLRSEVDTRLGEPRALVAGIQGVREGIEARDSELAHMLRRVAETCDVLAERVQLDRIERSALVDAVTRLSTMLAVTGTLPAPPIRANVIGGTVDPEQPPAATVIPPPEAPPVATVNDEIDLETEAEVAEVAAEIDAPSITAAAPARPFPRDGVEVRCRFGDRWVTGFEVCEVIRFDDVTRYRLRRRSDGSVLPTLFDEKDLRFFSTSFVDQ
jgi:hypothetical protein